MKIFKIIKELLFRKKTLTFVIWFVISAIISELHAISRGTEITLILDNFISNSESNFIIIASIILKAILVDGSIITLSILLGILCVIAFLKYKEISHNGVVVNGTKITKDEIINEVIRLIDNFQEIDSSSYVYLKNNIGNERLSEKLDFYYSFKRKRGNIHILEDYVKNSCIIEELTELL